MPLITHAYEQLFQKPCPYQTRMEYNRRLGQFNANIKLEHQTIQVNLNLQWKEIDDEIKMGLIQHLLCKLLHSKRQTSSISLYTNFVRNIDICTPLTKTNPLLEKSFHLLNEHFFANNMVMPNLQWGIPATRRLASYNFHNNTITVSSIFKGAPEEMLQYIMYHELLHKYHKFQHRGGRSSYHSTEFRQDEHCFIRWKELEKEISKFVREKQREKELQIPAMKELRKKWRLFSW